MAERGSVARDTFEQVQAIVADGTSLKAAFGRLATSSGRSAGTIQAAYYRHARKVGAVSDRLGRPSKAKTAARRGPAATRAPRAGRPVPATSDLATRLADAARTLQALAGEIADLERDAAVGRDVKRLITR